MENTERNIKRHLEHWGDLMYKLTEFQEEKWYNVIETIWQENIPKFIKNIKALVKGWIIPPH